MEEQLLGINQIDSEAIRFYESTPKCRQGDQKSNGYAKIKL